MARLLGIMVLLGVVFVSIDYATDNAPTAADNGPAVRTATGVSPIDALAFAGPSPVPEPTGSPTLSRWQFGAYTVGDSPDERVARYDRDLKAKEPLLVEDERLTGDLLPNYLRTIQGEILPGLYATDLDTSGCSYQLWRVMKGTRANRVIGEDFLSEGRLLVTIDAFEPDWFLSTASCGEWTEWQRRVDPTEPADNGDYWVGELAPGYWDVPLDCLWEHVVAFRGAALHDVVESGRGPDLLLVDDQTVGLRIRGCRQPLTRLN